MKNKLKRATALLMASVMVASLAACGGSNGSGDSTASGNASSDATVTKGHTETSTAVEGGTLTTYWSEFYNEFDPSVNDNRNFVTFYTDMLWNVDWDLDRSEYGFTSGYLNSDYISGQIAKSWEIADDNSSMTVTIRDDVTFQDKTAVGIDEEYDVYGGRALTAEDVKYTYDRLLGLDGVEQVTMDQTDWPNALYMLDSVEVVDDLTVQFNFNTTDEVSINDFMCAMVSICGPEWDELTEEQKADWHYAAGTGPFILTDYVNDNTMTFTKNPNYWDTDADGNALPYLDEIKLVHMTDSATMLSSFISGELDILAANNVLIDSDQETQLASSMTEDEDYYVVSYVGDSPAVCLKLGNNPVEALESLEVRTAMQYAIDLDAISEYKGYTYANDEEKSISIFAYGLPQSDITTWDDDLLDSYLTYDPDKAKEMLEEAGYGDGFEFDVYLYQAQPIDSFNLAAEYLAEVGITMNINVCSTPPEMTSHGADADDSASMYGSVGTDKIGNISALFRSDGIMNNVHQTNDELDALVDAFTNSATLEEQIENAKAFDAAYQAQHYNLMVSYAQRWSCYYNTRVHGLQGELVTKNYWAGYMFARTWVED